MRFAAHQLRDDIGVEDDGLARSLLLGSQPEAIAVVGGHRADTAPEQEMQRFAARFVKFDRSEAAAFVSIP
jgi:hypothetical protein